MRSRPIDNLLLFVTAGWWLRMGNTNEGMITNFNIRGALDDDANAQ